MKSSRRCKRPILGFAQNNCVNVRTKISHQQTSLCQIYWGGRSIPGTQRWILPQFEGAESIGRAATRQTPFCVIWQRFTRFSTAGFPQKPEIRIRPPKRPLNGANLLYFEVRPTASPAASVCEVRQQEHACRNRRTPHIAGLCRSANPWFRNCFRKNHPLLRNSYPNGPASGWSAITDFGFLFGGSPKTLVSSVSDIVAVSRYPSRSTDHSSCRKSACQAKNVRRPTRLLRNHCRPRRFKVASPARLAGLKFRHREKRSENARTPVRRRELDWCRWTPIEVSS